MDFTPDDLIYLKFDDLEAELGKLLDRGTIEENLKIQLDEYEALASTYCNPGELTLNQSTAIADITSYLNGGQELPIQLDYSIYLTRNDCRIEVSVNLPTDYPNIKPDIYARCGSIVRSEQQALNEELQSYLETLPNGEVCVFYALNWLEENFSKFANVKKTLPSDKVLKKEESDFSRLWIYSHHIYSKTKRRELMESAEELNLTGFLLPGRPGVICVEGLASNCEEWWSRVRSMSWKKIALVFTETEKFQQDNNMKKFESFEEIGFKGGKIKGREIHMNFGEFFKFLGTHGCEHAFKKLFGVEGKTSQE